jgi:hypothetical protein
VKFLPIVSVIFLSSLFSITSAKASDQDTQFWSSFAINGPVSDDSELLVWFDGHARFSDDASRLGVSIIRPAVGMRYSENTTLWLGYARVTSHPGDDVEEDRIWQQALYKLPGVFGGSFSGRTRIEQRDRDGGGTGHRVRQFLRWSKPIENSDLSYVVANELFVGVNDTDWGQKSGLDQNRLFLGFNYQIDDNNRVEFGYINNEINRVGPDNQTNHIAGVTWFAKL